jgi:hypothetical protein
MAVLSKSGQIRFFVAGHPVVHYPVVLVDLEVQDQGLRSAQRDEVFSQGAYELVGVFNHVFGETVHSEINGC